MNRRARRKAAAENRNLRGEATVALDPSQSKSAKPENYEATCQEMLERTKRWLREQPDRPPHFVGPPEGICIVGSLDQVGDRFCRNDAARELVADFIEIGIRIGGGPTYSPTVLMMLVVLQVAGVAFERVSMTELGLSSAGIS